VRLAPAIVIVALSALLAGPAFAQTGAHTHPDLEGFIADHEARLQALEALHAPPPPLDLPPVAVSLTASCDEGGACSGDIGATDDSGSVSVSWGAAGLTGFVGNADGTWSAAPVDGDGQAVYGIGCVLDDGVNPPVACSLSVTVSNTITAPPPPPAGNLQALRDMPAGSWLPYGDPWSNLETTGALQQNRDNCNKGLDALAGSWNGVVWDGGRYLWQFAPGGHGDACFNGVIRYDLETGLAEVMAPHIPLNMPVLFTYAAGADGWNMPYASATPWAACAGQGINCEALSKADRLANGPSYDAGVAIQSEAIGQEVYGAFLRPRSSHTRQNTVKIGDYIYLYTSHTYGSIKEGHMVFRFLASDPANTIERMPDRIVGGSIVGGVSLNFIQPPGLGTFMIAGSDICEIDPAAGIYNCSSFPTNLSVNAVAMWDDERSGVWVYDPNKQINNDGGPAGILTFVEYVAGSWVKDNALTVGDNALFSGSGVAGICIVPTANGTNPVIWGDGSRLVRWDGTALTEVTGQTNQPAGHNHVQNKWAWNEDLGVCLGTWSWNEGIWAWRPDFSNWEEASAPLPPDPEEEPAPGSWPTFAGHTVAPVAQTLAAWDEPIERQPEAPDYDALCPGEWAVLDYRTEADVAGSAVQTRGLGGNVRIYLHPREDAPGPYGSTVVFDKVLCAELVGVPANDNRPQLAGGGVAFPKTGTGLIVRGIDFIDSNIGWACHQPSQSCPAFTVLHDNRIGGVGLLGDADPRLPQTYLEFRGNFFGPNLDWHGIYLERSIGQLVALGNVFHASGNAGHALKNLANYSRIEGNVLSNVDIDGQPLSRNGVNDVIGLFSLDHYACTDSIIRNNTIVFRTSGNVATLLTLRGRNAWGNCDKGPRQADGNRPVWAPESPEYLDEQRWAEIATAAEDFALGYEVARENPELFTHLIEDNTFIVFDAHSNTPRALTVHSMRPIADNTIEAGLKAQMLALITLCRPEADYDACWFANASPEVRYVHDHIDPTRRTLMRTGNGQGRVEVPNSLPIPAPAGWVERTGVYWDEDQTFIACNADGSQCVERGPYAMDITPQPWDGVPLSSPPRLLAR
jgi:hypothetical protein